MTDNADTILGVVHDEALAHEWELVLLAQGLSPTNALDTRGYRPDRAVR